MLGEDSKRMRSKIAVGDADSLVALVYRDDSNHLPAQKVSEWLQSEGYEVIYPNTAILEAITALKRSLNLTDEAHLLNKQYQAGVFSVEFISEETQLLASQRFEKTISKKNTIFDAVVAQTAIKVGAEHIFSFDSWYLKQGFKLTKVPEE